ncbi:DUF2309 family protein [Seongchinamella sediminis]|uniref:Probable inorganic carbon transporter subunit DabA n=2 Tax=Seongchinamella sediminis TaxID=2283635 RepID=A0A3L7DX09_9GAMM|nr:DUF2309 family protein [Seongchinamella sediminis]
MPEPTLETAVNAAIDAAIDTVAPTWPLDRMIAVNPYWGRIHQHFEEARQSLAHIAGSPLALAPAHYREAWERGDIAPADLERAAQELGFALSIRQLVAALQEDDCHLRPAPLLSDALDSQRDLQHEPAWCDTLTHQVAQFCGAYFDRDQADWQPTTAPGLYASWRSALTRDHSVALLMKAADIPARAADLAVEPERQIARALQQLAVPESDWNLYLQAVVMRLSGWAAWCAYLRWQARLADADDRTLVDLLAIRLSWECLLDDGRRSADSVWSRWQNNWQRHFQAAGDSAPAVQAVWQRAEEISYQNSLVGTLTTAPVSAGSATPEVQAAFCIDVRSEVFRRHLESQSQRIQTIGFAGFFGLPISYTPLGTTATRPQLPGLLAPAIAITDHAADEASGRQIAQRRDGRLRAALGWRNFQSLPLSAFTLVETMGLGYLAKLVKRTLPGIGDQRSDADRGLSASDRQELRPMLDEDSAGGAAAQAELAAQVLTGMGLGGSLARLVLLIGHGSQVRNNPHRAGLDCGACCGQTGEVNARALSAMLNDPAVREGVRERGIDIPADTLFVAGLHNTTTDEVQLLDLDTVPASHSQAIGQLTSELEAAGREARRERAPALGLSPLVDEPRALHRAMRQRANDWAQTRPEWGLANNAAFVVAPRSTTRGVDLQGRSFLHDYDYRRDPDGALLEQIMTAPMIVTHWINMQYLASSADNRRFGSGNKTLHNVVGGRLGVFEGNGGDLRIGLPLQSVHDGERWRHRPLRLSVVIRAPRESIEAVLAKHPTVRQLVENQWLYLLRWEGERIELYRAGHWQEWTNKSQQSSQPQGEVSHV